MISESPEIDTAAEEAFERWLLASAKSDAPTEGAAKVALARFALAAAKVTAIGAESSVASASRTARSVAKWLAVGALMSTALGTAYVEGTRHGSVPRGPAAQLLAATARTTTATVTTGTGAASEQRRPPRATTTSDGSLAAKRSAPTRATAARETRKPPVAPTSTSASLREEVTRLDAARTALAIGDFDAVSQTLERYRLDFPDGVLAREADLVAISALSEKGDRAEALRRARRFLSSYPRDVHAARVKQLVSWQALAEATE